MGNYLQEISAATGMPFYAKKGPYASNSGSIIGVRNGYLTAIGGTKVGNTNAVGLLIRYKQVADQAAVVAAITDSAAFLDAIGEKKWKKSIAERLTVGTDYLRFDWTYSLRKPPAEKVAAVQAALVEAIRTVTPPLDAKCDICHTATVGEVALYNGIPGHYCLSCQGRTHDEQNAAAAEYEGKETNVARGLLFGIVAAIAGALAWGLVAYGINRIFLYGAVLIGLLIAKAVFYGIGKINLVGQISVFVLTIASVLLGDAIFFTLAVMKSENLPFSGELLGAIVRHMWEIEKADNQGFVTVGFALVGAVIVLWSNRKPKFVAEFEPLGVPVSEHSPELVATGRE